MTKALELSGIQSYFSNEENTSTGSCAILFHKKQRTICVNLGASVKYGSEHLTSNFSVLENASFLYSSGYFISSNYDALMRCAQYAADTNKPFGFNFSASFIIQYKSDKINTILEYTDYIFCNEDEAKCFAEIY